MFAKKPLIGALVAVAAFIAIVLGLGPTPNPAEPIATAANYQTMPTASAISLFQDRVASNGADAVSATILGELFSRQARETGDISKLALAESSLDRALEALPGYPRAQTALSAVYVSQHRFSEALDLARIANEGDPDGGAIISLGDAQLALGEYQAAKETFLEAIDRFSVPVVSARLAHIDEIYGDLEGARLSIDKAARVFVESGGSGEAAAWFQMRRGDLAFASGEYEAAADAYAASLQILPDYPQSLAGLARSQEAMGDRESAIANFEKAVAVQPLPAVLLDLGELYQLEGQTDKAAETFGTLTVIGELSNGLFDISLVFYEANHGDAEVAIHLARGLVESRPDLFSYDALAWALYRAGDFDAARRAADEATSTNPAIASIWYHSGAIRAALDDVDAALSHLESALDLSPRFDPTAAEHIDRLFGILKP